MPCYHPLQAVYHPTELTKNGKRVIKFSNSRAALFKSGFDLSTLSTGQEGLQLPCGRCVGCRLERSRQWAIRCMHEASLHDDNCFITLTIAPEHMPEDGSLDVREFQLFMKKLRKKFGSGIRFFHCGEYGETFSRPHYHACIFGFDFPDKLHWKDLPTGHRLYTSDALGALWTKGYHSIGSVTFESAAYVARYIMKKVTGEMADTHYQGRKPEYTTMSRRPGIGSDWIHLFHLDTYPSDSVVLRGREMKPPRFYDKFYELEYPQDFERIKESRVEKSLERMSDNTFDRLSVREICKKSHIKQLVRTVDLEN